MRGKAGTNGDEDAIGGYPMNSNSIRPVWRESVQPGVENPSRLAAENRGDGPEVMLAGEERVWTLIRRGFAGCLEAPNRSLSWRRHSLPPRTSAY